MKVSLAFGTEVDIVTGDEMKHGLDDLWSKFEKHGRKGAANFLNLSNGTTFSATELSINLSRPSIGRIWNVLSVAVVTTDVFTASAGKAAVFTGNPNNVIRSHCRIPGFAVPGYQSSEPLWCHSTEELFVYLGGFTNGDVVIANAQVAEYREQDISMHSGK